MKQYSKSNYARVYDCPDGWQCQHLLKRQCKNKHEPDDLQNAKSLKNILKRHPQQHIVIIVKETQKGQNKHICLFDGLLPITFIDLPERSLEIDIYYLGSFVKVQDRRAIIKYMKELGPFQKYSSVDRILNDFCLPEYYLAERQNQKLDGHVKIIDHTRKMLITKDRPIFLEQIRQYRDYPVLHGSKVQYYVDRGVPKLTKIIHPRDIRVSGILQIDHNSMFYLIPRNTDFDDMNPYLVPRDVEKMLEKHSLFPYSLFHENSLSKEKQKQINQMLNNVLLKGYFKGWPLNYRFPLVDLEEEIAERNLKNTKNAIIFESGIEIRPFSKRQKKEADAIADKFKINNFGKRQLFEDVFTIDSKHTKCHDDSLSIQSLPNERMKISVHIADAAALIKAGSYLDDQIKKRDETIYIKNYHQPMVPESLKKLLSLNHNKEKIAFSLSFELTSKGFIDFSTIKFYKSIVKVKQNLAHETLSKQPHIFPQIFKFETLTDKSNLVDSNYILDCETKSETAVTKLIYLSSIIPTFLLERNIERCNKIKQQLSEFIKKIIDSKSQAMEKWQQEVTKINKSKKQELKIKKQILEIDKIIKKEVEFKRKEITKEIADEQRKRKEEQKKEKKQARQKRERDNRGRGRRKDEQYDDYSDSEDEYSKNTELELADNIEGISNVDKKSVLSRDEQMLLEDITDQKEQQLRQKRLKNMKEAKKQQSESQSELSSDDSDLSQLVGEDQQFKMRNARGGMKYLETIFSYFKINIQWKSIKEINDVFNDILSRSKSKLYQEYFKRMQIMNRQHFKYIINIVKRQQKEVRGEERRPRQRNINRNINNQQKQQEKTHQEIYIVPKEKGLNNRFKQQESEAKKDEQLKSVVGSEKKTQYRRKDEVKQEKQQVKKEQMPKNLETKQQKDNKYHKQEIKDDSSLSLSQPQSSVQRNKKQTHAQRRQRQHKEKLQKQSQPQKTRKQHHTHFDKKENRSKESEYKLSADGELIKTKMYDKIKENDEYYADKYMTAFINKQKFQVSDDEFINEAENEEVKNILKAVKKAGVMNAIRIAQKKIKKNQPIKTKIQIKQKNQCRDEMSILAQKYLSDKSFLWISDKKDNEQRFQQQEKTKNKDKFKEKPVDTEKRNQIMAPQSSIEVRIVKLSPPEPNQTKKVQQQSCKVKDELDYLVKKYIQLDNHPQQREQRSTVGKQSQKNKLLTKKQLKTKIDTLLKQYTLQIKQKHSVQKKQLSEKLHQVEQKTKQASKDLKQQLTKASFDYNLIKFIATQEENQEQEKEEPTKKGKKKKKETKKKKKRSIYSDFLDNFEVYADKANFKFDKMNEDQINLFLKQKFSIDPVCEQKQIESINRQASKMGEEEDQLLKWNNPIRSYQALQTMRVIKYYSWLFQSDLQPIDILLYGSDLKNIKHDLKALQKYKDAKFANGDSNKKAKQANRQIAKIEFYHLIQKDTRVTHTFLTITSRPSSSHQRVFHPILQEIQIEKSQRPFKGNELYKEVQGRVLVKKQFPLEFTVELI